MNPNNLIGQKMLASIKEWLCKFLTNRAKVNATPDIGILMPCFKRDGPVWSLLFWVKAQQLAKQEKKSFLSFCNEPQQPLLNAIFKGPFLSPALLVARY